jgi:hypothetical protein
LGADGWFSFRGKLTDSGGNTVTDDVFKYDVEDRHIGKSVNGTQSRTSYDGPNAWGDYNSGGTLTTRHRNGNAIDQLFARYDGATVAYYG